MLIYNCKEVRQQRQGKKKVQRKIKKVLDKITNRCYNKGTKGKEKKTQQIKYKENLKKYLTMYQAYAIIKVQKKMKERYTKC